MKAIFTGTEQDLIDVGFEREELTSFFRIIHEKENITHYFVRTSYVKENKRNHIYKVVIFGNKILMSEYFKDGVKTLNDNSLIQDLIDKNLVRFEKE